MSEDRLERMKKMMGDLIRIVGHTNSVLEEMNSDIQVLKKDAADLRVGQEKLREDLDSFRLDVIDRFAELDGKVDFIKYKLNENEEQIFLLKRAANK